MLGLMEVLSHMPRPRPDVGEGRRTQFCLLITTLTFVLLPDRVPQETMVSVVPSLSSRQFVIKRKWREDDLSLGRLTFASQ